jgi:hypothetical protein
MGNPSSDAGHPSALPELPDLTECVRSMLLWLADELSRRTEGETHSPWLTAKEASTYTRIPYESFRKLAKDVPRHRYSEQGWVYHRHELDIWLTADANRYWEDR